MAGAFTLQIEKFIAKAQANTREVVTKVATDLMTAIVLRTPVDTGRARASWGVGLNHVDADAAVTLVDPAGQRTIALGRTSISKWQPDDSIFIASNLPYIGPLEYGHSQQAPAGMLRVSVAEAQSFVNAAVRSLSK